jgi:hypothetical protein
MGMRYERLALNAVRVLFDMRDLLELIGAVEGVVKRLLRKNVAEPPQLTAGGRFLFQSLSDPSFKAERLSIEANGANRHMR